jgi:outer membrane protein OmpA-like peptidoglycan-associated protein
MKKITSTILLISLVITGIFAQSKVIFREDFTNPKMSYFTTSNIQGFKSTIENGHFVYDNTGTSWRYSSTSVAYDKNQDFLFEVKFTKTEGAASKKYGVVFNLKNIDNRNTFIFSNDGNYELEVRTDKEVAVSKKGTFKGVNASGDNLLQISKKGNNYTFYINDVKVLTLKDIPVHSNYFGVFTEGPNKMLVDYIQMKQDDFRPLKLVKDIPSGLVKENLGNMINTSYSDVGPVIAPDGQTLFYSIKNYPENTGGADDKDEIYFSKRQRDGSWGLRKNIGYPLNNKAPNSVISVSPDNNTMVVRGTYKADGSSAGGGISVTTRTERGWSMPEKLEIENFKTSSSTTEFAMSADGQFLLMSIQHDVNYGDKDIYVSKRKPNGTFGPPINLGPVVNTWLEEMSPFLAADGVTLYFSSYGHSGYGSADVFMTKRLDDTWQKWTEPENLGPEINGPEWNAYFVIPASGEFAYMASVGEFGNSDIFRVKLPMVLRPDPVVMISGKVINSKTKEPLAAEITYRNLKTDEVLGIAKSSPEDGSYKIILPAGNEYSFLAEKKGFIATSESFNTKVLKEYSETNKDLYLTPLEVGQTVRLNNVFFDFAKFSLREESFPELNRVVKLLQDNPGMKIEVAGHTDSVGSAESNLSLSQNRANSVKEYLLSKNISADRVVSKGYGLTKPVATNDTDEGRQLNRRVEFTILQK